MKVSGKAEKPKGSSGQEGVVGEGQVPSKRLVTVWARCPKKSWVGGYAQTCEGLEMGVGTEVCHHHTCQEQLQKMAEETKQQYQNIESVKRDHFKALVGVRTEKDLRIPMKNLNKRTSEAV
jgi:hypothetical protein